MNSEFRKKEVKNLTMEAISKGIYKETAQFGFSTQDYIKLVNSLLDLTMTNSIKNNSSNGGQTVKEKVKKIELPIQGENVIVRLFDEKKDKKTVTKWLNDEKGRLFLLSRLTSKRCDFDELIHNKDNEFGIVTTLNSDPIGLLGFLNIDQKQRKAELRKLIGVDEYRGRGYAKEATKLWIDYGIHHLNLRKIYLHTIGTNIANIRLNKDLGFKIEGILRQETLIDNEFQDVLRMALIVDHQ